MMHMYPYNNLNSFEGESSFVQAQGFTFQQQQNLYDQFVTDPSIFDNYDTINVLVPKDQHFTQYNFQQNLQNFENPTKKIKSNHVYSKFTIPSITSIISRPTITNNTNTMNFLVTNPILQQQSSSLSITPSSNTPMDIDFNYNVNANLLIQSQVQLLNALSYFATPGKDTVISPQDIIDGMKVMQEISLQGVMNNLVTDLNENPIDWFIQENWKEMSKQLDTCEFKESSTEKKKLDEKLLQNISNDLIEEHMKEVRKIVHNEILCQEILTESSSLEYQDLSFKNPKIDTSQAEESNCSISTTTTYNQYEINQEAVVAESSSSKMLVSQENNLSYDPILTIGETSSSTNLAESRSYTADKRTFKCNEIGCSRGYNCYAKLKSHKIIHTNDKPFICNFLGCNRKFKRSGELIKHQLDHLN